MYIYTYAKDIFQDHQRHERFGRLGAPLLQAADEEGSEAYGAGNEGSYTSGSSEIFFMCFFSHQKVGGCVSKSKIDKFIN